MSESKSKVKVVVIGGGNGSAKSIKAVKKFSDEIRLTSVVSMSDSGGSSGVLRLEFGGLPTGDILRAILAMSKYDYKILKRIFYGNRFADCGKLTDHNIGNLFLNLTANYAGDFMTSVKALSAGVETVGAVFPCTLDNTNLVAELSAGQIITGESKIDRPDYERSNKIKKVWLEPVGRAYAPATEAIVEADFIIIGPGSLYCSIIAALLPLGMKEAIAQSKAKIIYVAGNAYEAEGETGPEKLSDFVRQLEVYLPRPIATVINNNRELSVEKQKEYQEKRWKLFEADPDNLTDRQVISGDYERDEIGNPGLSDAKLGDILSKILFN
ncbi:MAG: uridine diphosphate-N-acetylglucosamine-binding protein YvcK [Patescibacteria group bacterium]